MKKKLCAVLLSAALAIPLICSTTVSAAESTDLVKTETTIVTAPENTADALVLKQSTLQEESFAKELEENGTKYRLQFVTFTVQAEKAEIIQEEITTQEKLTVPQASGADFPKTMERYCEETGKTEQYHLKEDSIRYAESAEKTQTIPQVEATRTSTPSAAEPSFAETMAYTYTMPDGRQIPCVLSLASVTPNGSSTWQEIDPIEIQVKRYDADYYLLGDVQIPRNEAVPALQGYDLQVLRATGFSPQQYRILGYVWSSEPYTVDGIEYRNAIAHTERLGQGYTATYRATNVQVPAYTATATYEAKVAMETGNYLYKVTGTAVYEQEKGLSLLATVTICAVGILILIFLVILILYVIARRRKKERKA